MSGIVERRSTFRAIIFYANKRALEGLLILKECSFFDIETTGVSIYDDEPTVVGCHHKGKMLVFLNGDNLDDFLDLLHDVKLLVSSMARVMCPLWEYFHIPTLPCPHVDLGDMPPQRLEGV